MSEQETQVLEAEHRLRRSAVLLAALAKSPAFEFLYGEIEKKRARMQETLTSRLMGGEGLDTLQRQIDYDRGYVDGMAYPKAVVTGAVNKVAEIEAPEEPDTEVTSDGWAGPSDNGAAEG